MVCSRNRLPALKHSSSSSVIPITNVRILRAQRQDRLAAFETAATPGYNLVNANLSYTQHVGDADLTWFALAKNLLNQDIRMSTSVLKDVAPLPGRSLMVGLS